MESITSFARLLDTLEAAGKTVKTNGTTAMAQCPAHDDNRPSLSLRRIAGSVLLYCHAGCDTADILAALNLTLSALFDNPSGQDYPYRDGRVVHRSPDKNFRQSGNTKDRSLFRAERIIFDTTIVYVVEGEKDVLAVESAGAVAVCSAMGAGKAHLADWSVLNGLHVIIVADRDEAGRKHAAQVTELLKSIAASVRIMEAAVGKDPADHIAAGKGLAELVAARQDPPDEPVPLTEPVPIPPFPVDALPTPVAAMVNAVAEATQTDPAMAGTCAVSTLSVCAGGHAEIEIRPGWREPLNTYTANIAESGERKSAVQQAMSRVLQTVEQGLTETTMPARLEAQARKQIAERKAERARNDAAAPRKGDDAGDRLEAENAAIEAAKAAAEIDVPPMPRLYADDATPEATASLLAEQKGRVAIVSSEGGIFDIIAGRYSGSVPNMDVYLKGHAGDPIRIDRKGRPPEYIPRPALTLGLMIQPEVLKTIAAQRAFRGRGLLARFLYALPVSKVGRRRIAANPVLDAVTNAYNDLVAKLASGLAQWAGDPAVLVLTAEAQEALRGIEAAVEPQLASDGELAALKDWGSKYVGAVARIAGVIHLAEHGSDTGPTTSVSATTIAAAYRIGEYFKACAVNAFIEMGTDQATADAMYLLARIGKHWGDGDELSERDMQRACQSRFRKKDALSAAIDRLVDHGYLIKQQTDRATGGRPASPRYVVKQMTNAQK